MKDLKLVFGFSHFFNQNTPKPAQIIGDISLVLAAIAAVPVVLSTAGVAVPVALVTVGSYAVAGGILVKKISKMFGIVDDNGTPVNVITPTPATENK